MDLEEEDLHGSSPSGLLKKDSSAYSSLGNSSFDLDSRPTSRNLTRSSSKSSVATIPCSTKSAEEMRAIADNFNDLLKTATKEIKKLVAEKRKLQTDYEKLLGINEELADNLSKTIKKEKELQAEKADIIEANKELYGEAQRLTDEEAKWIEEKGKLQCEIRELQEQIREVELEIQKRTLREINENPKKPLDDDEEDELDPPVNKNEVIESLREENAKLLKLYKSCNCEKDDLLRENERLRVENESLLSRKEIVSGENLQLMVEVDNQSKQFRSLREENLRNLEKIRQLETKNKELKSASSVSPAERLLAERATQKAADLAEKNKNLLEWRNQLTEKNQTLMAENAKLKAKVTNLEELLNEESADINEVLELIKNLQVQATNHSCAIPASAIGPISKFRDLKLPPH